MLNCSFWILRLTLKVFWLSKLPSLLLEFQVISLVFLSVICSLEFSLEATSGQISGFGAWTQFLVLNNDKTRSDKTDTNLWYRYSVPAEKLTLYKIYRAKLYCKIYVTSTILNSEVKCPTGRWWSVPQTRGRRELPRLQSSTIRVLARYITAPPVSDVHRKKYGTSSTRG